MCLLLFSVVWNLKYYEINNSYAIKYIILFDNGYYAQVCYDILTCVIIIIIIFYFVRIFLLDLYTLYGNDQIVY